MEKDFTQIFMNNVTNLIETTNLKKKEFAKKCGYTPQALSDLLHGRKRIMVNDVIKLCKALNVTPNQLYGINKY